MKLFSLATLAGALLLTSSSAFADPHGPDRFGPRDDFHPRREPVPPAFFERGPRGRFAHRHFEPPFDLGGPRREMAVDRAVPQSPVVNVTPVPPTTGSGPSSPRGPSNSTDSVRPKPTTSQGGSGQQQPKPSGQGSGSTRPLRPAS